MGFLSNDISRILNHNPKIMSQISLICHTTASFMRTLYLHVFEKRAIELIIFE